MSGFPEPTGYVSNKQILLESPDPTGFRDKVQSVCLLPKLHWPANGRPGGALAIGPACHVLKAREAGWTVLAVAPEAVIVGDAGLSGPIFSFVMADGCALTRGAALDLVRIGLVLWRGSSGLLIACHGGRSRSISVAAGLSRAAYDEPPCESVWDLTGKVCPMQTVMEEPWKSLQEAARTLRPRGMPVWHAETVTTCPPYFPFGVTSNVVPS